MLMAINLTSIKALIRLKTMLIVLLNFSSHTYTVGTVLTAADVISIKYRGECSCLFTKMFLLIIVL